MGLTANHVAYGCYPIVQLLRHLAIPIDVQKSQFITCFSSSAITNIAEKINYLLNSSKEIDNETHEKQRISNTYRAYYINNSCGKKVYLNQRIHVIYNDAPNVATNEITL